MSGKVTKLKVVPPRINADAIEIMQQTLTRLRAGEVVAVAVVEVYRNGDVATDWSQSRENYHQLNSGAARLSARIAVD